MKLIVSKRKGTSKTKVLLAHHCVTTTHRIINMLFTLTGSPRSFINSLIDFLYPPLCLSCHRLMKNGGDHVCPTCWDSILIAGRASPLVMETSKKLVASGVVDDLISLYVFEKEGVFQVIAHNLKYGGVQELGTKLGRHLGQVFVRDGIRADAIIPVPLHRRKLRERGYNQAELIARGVSNVSGIQVRCDLVRRKRYTQTQTLLSLKERRENMDEAFEVPTDKRSEVNSKNFVVVDDVVTTGSTMVACAAVLRAAGAIGVIGASAALAE
jgi:ComF family protein